MPSVGVSGKHYTSFCMVGQTAIANKDGYWKDRCIDLDFELMTKEFGIPEHEISFIESVWTGAPGAFGYCLEYFVRGLELGNAVFTAFEGDITNYREMKEPVIDMGAGLERFSWITQGTPTSYDATFAPVLAKMQETCKVEYDRDLFMRYSRLAGTMNLDEFATLTEARREMAKVLGVEPGVILEKLGPVEALYAIADHARTLLFAVADGQLPSNVGGGYNLRVLFRQGAVVHPALQASSSTSSTWSSWQAQALSEMYPELVQHHDDVSKVLRVEESRYASSTQRVSKVVASLAASKKEVGLEDLVKLYESDGITPEQLVQGGAEGLGPRGLLPAGCRQARQPEGRGEGPEVRRLRPPGDRAALLRGRRHVRVRREGAEDVRGRLRRPRQDGLLSRGEADRSQTTGRSTG